MFFPLVPHASHQTVSRLRPLVCRVVQLHSELLQQVHSGDLPASGNKVLLMEGLLSPEDVRFLKCVADAVHCPYELCSSSRQQP